MIQKNFLGVFSPENKQGQGHYFEVKVSGLEATVESDPCTTHRELAKQQSVSKLTIDLKQIGKSKISINGCCMN